MAPLNDFERNFVIRFIIGIVVIAIGNVFCYSVEDRHSFLFIAALLVLSGGYSIIFGPHLPRRFSKYKPKPFPGLSVGAMYVLYLGSIGANVFLLLSMKTDVVSNTHLLP